MYIKVKILRKEFFQYIILNICGMIGLSCYILADTFFISNGLGSNGLTAQIISLSRGFLIIISMAFFLSFLFEMMGVWLSFPITEGFVTLTGIALYIKAERGKPSIMKQGAIKKLKKNGKLYA